MHDIGDEGGGGQGSGEVQGKKDIQRVAGTEMNVGVDVTHFSVCGVS